jgi:hypothetical protein
MQAGAAGVSNSDLYTEHFESLEQNHRCSVCPLFKGVHVYIVPVIPETKLFCKQMGVIPLKLQSATNRNVALEEETQYFAYFCHIKQAFTKKMSFLNPQVVCHAEEMQRAPKRIEVKRQPVPSLI